MQEKQRIFRANGLVAFPSFVADIFAMCGTEDLEIKSLTIKIFEEPILPQNHSANILCYGAAVDEHRYG